MTEMGRGFKAPLRRNIEGWKVVEALCQAGFYFPATTRRERPSFPTRLREVAEFIEQNPHHRYRMRVT